MIERDWNIQPPTGKCFVTGRRFRNEEVYFAMLLETADGLVRQDFSAEAWAERPADQKALSFWRSEFKVAPPEPERTIAQDDAESLLRRMIEGADPATENARYILAVMLERKKKFYHRDTVEHDGRPCLVYEHKETGETFLITDPRLKLSELHLVQMEVAELLRPRPKEEVARQDQGSPGDGPAPAQAAGPSAEEPPGGQTAQ
ncbi:MAG TPA: hypothetical protein PLU30_19855 [Verrucomicrobiae bacterium]|nr:hypothetical protein [Verrucomicrobiae bacterium]